MKISTLSEERVAKTFIKSAEWASVPPDRDIIWAFNNFTYDKKRAILYGSLFYKPANCGKPINLMSSKVFAKHSFKKLEINPQIAKTP